MMSSTKQNQKQTISYNTFDPTKVQIGEYADTKFNPSQKTALIRYKVDSYSEIMCQIQSPDIRLFTYGIPRENKKYYATDKSRCFVKIPEDVNDPKSVAFFSKLEQVDKIFDTEEYKIKQFGKNAKSYKYVPIVRVRTQDEEEYDDDEETKPKNTEPSPRYIKVKVQNDYETGNILTKCFIKNGSERVPVEDIVTIDDLAKYVRYRSTIKMVFIFNKSYMSKNKVANADFKNYGITLQLKQIVCEAPQSSNLMNRDIDAFIDDEDDDNDNLHNLASVRITKNSKSPDDEDIDNDNLYHLASVKITKNSKSLDDNTVKIQIDKKSHKLDDDDEDEEDAVQTKKSSPKDDEDNEDDEDDRQSVQSTASGKKVVKATRVVKRQTTK